MDGGTPIGFVGKVELERTREDGDIALQSSTLELTGVGGRALRIICALQIIYAEHHD